MMTPDLTTHPTLPPRTAEPASNVAPPYSPAEEQSRIVRDLCMLSRDAEAAGLTRMAAQIDAVIHANSPRLVGGTEVA